MQSFQTVRKLAAPQPHSVRAAQQTLNPAETDIAELFDVMDELVELIEAENDLLRRGMPAALSEYSEQKTALSREYTRLCRKVMGEHAQFISDHDTLRLRMIDMGEVLKTLSQENMRRLEAALEATRRRIEAVMMAIRAHDQESGSYQPNGAMLSGRFVHGTTRYEI